jgi:hypothetical protein
MGLRILFIGVIMALAGSFGVAQATTSQPTAVVVAPTAVAPMVGSPIVTNPIVSTPSVHFENGPNGTTIPVVTNSAVVTQTTLPASSAAPEEAVNDSQPRDLNLGNVQSISDLYSADHRSVAEVARTYKARQNGVQNAHVYTNADIDRIRQQSGESSSSTAMPAGSMPASDQAAEQNNQATTPQVPPPAASQKPSPFSPKK